MRVDGFSRVANLNEVGESIGLQRGGTGSSQLSSYFQDGIDFPVVAADKKGGGDGGKVTIGKGDKIQVECEGGGRPQINSIKGGGYELNCPDNGGGKGSGAGKKEGPPPQKDGPSPAPIVP